MYTQRFCLPDEPPVRQTPPETPGEQMIGSLAVPTGSERQLACHSETHAIEPVARKGLWAGEQL
jgi:hypothetical protein